MAVRTSHVKPQVTTRSPNYSLGGGADLPIARIVAFLLLVLPIVGAGDRQQPGQAGPVRRSARRSRTSTPSSSSPTTPRTSCPSPWPRSRPTTDAGPPAPAASDPAAADQEAAVERVKVANTGGVGAILRADPPRGRQIAALRDGQPLDVLEHQTVGDSEWLRVKTADGVEGWIFSRLVGPAQ